MTVATTWQNTKQQSTSSKGTSNSSCSGENSAASMIVMATSKIEFLYK